jgi:hypothetical protein
MLVAKQASKRFLLRVVKDKDQPFLSCSDLTQRVKD